MMGIGYSVSVKKRLVAWTPPERDSLDIWVAGDHVAQIVAKGEYVGSSYTDKAGTEWSQSIQAKQPTLGQDTHGAWYLWFDGDANQKMEATQSLGTAYRTEIMVVAWDTLTTYSTPLSYCTTGDAYKHSVFVTSSGSLYFRKHSNDCTTYKQCSETGTMTAGAVQLVSAWVTTTGKDTYQYVQSYNQGHSSSATSKDEYCADAVKAVLGNSYNNLDGKIYELLVWDSDIGEDNRTAVIEHLHNKYADSLVIVKK